MKRYLIGPVFMFAIISCAISGSQQHQLTDVEGNSYPVKKFNDEVWMTENLKVTKSKEGESVKVFIPNNDSGNIKNYGLLYDFETACKVCPKGWHLPSDKEWDDLIESLGKHSGNAIKDSLYWKSSDQNFSDKSGFSVRPAGYGNTGEFENYFGTRAIFWSATKVDSHFVWGFVLADKADSIRKAPQHPTYAFSVRCIRDKQVH